MNPTIVLKYQEKNTIFKATKKQNSIFKVLFWYIATAFNVLFCKLQ